MGGTDSSGFVGAHHFGFLDDDADAMRQHIEPHGGTFFFTLSDLEDKNFDLKFRDSDGVIFDISSKGWLGST